MPIDNIATTRSISENLRYQNYKNLEETVHILMKELKNIPYFKRLIRKTLTSFTIKDVCGKRSGLKSQPHLRNVTSELGDYDKHDRIFLLLAKVQIINNLYPYTGQQIELTDLNTRLEYKNVCKSTGEQIIWCPVRSNIKLETIMKNNCAMIYVSETLQLCRDNTLVLFTEKEMKDSLKIVEESEKSQNGRITISQSYLSKWDKSIERFYVSGKIDQGMEYYKDYHKLLLIHAQLKYINQIPIKTKPEVLFTKDKNGDYDKVNENFHLNIKVYSCHIHYNDYTTTLLERSSLDSKTAPIDNLKARLNKDVDNNTIDEDSKKNPDVVAVSCILYMQKC